MARFFSVIGAALLTLAIVSSASAIVLGKAQPRPVVYRTSASRAMIYDARPELGLTIADLSKGALAAADSIGVRLVRHTLYWNKMETTDKPGLYDSKYLDEWDGLVEECRKSGLYLVVVIEGDPPGVSFNDRPAAYRRLARFASDMAARYPSVVYWEMFGQQGQSIAGTIMPNDYTPAADGGKAYAEMLSVVSPAVKAANPAALVVATADTEDFLKGLYDGGGRDHFDVLNAATGVQSEGGGYRFYAERMKSVMAEFDDSGKPVWNTIRSVASVDTSACDEYFKTNNERGMYQKIFLSIELDADGTDSTLLTWLVDGDLNRSLLDNPRTVQNIFVSSRAPIAPVGFECEQVEGGIEISRVVVDTLVPTRIDLLFLGEPEPAGPDGQTVSPKRKSTRPHPDPWDI